MGCADRNPPLTATLTFRKDGTHFSGTVVRRDANSITITGEAGDTHTFLYTELSDIKEGVTDAKTVFSAPGTATPQVLPGEKPASAAEAVIPLPEGTYLPVRSSGFLDSCCVPIQALALGVMDANVKNSKGTVVIPQGASVTFTLKNEEVVDGRVTMQFELASADFDNRHYIVSSAKGGSERGAVVTFSGPKDGSPEARLRGNNLHIDDNSSMLFKAVTPVIFTLSK